MKNPNSLYYSVARSATVLQQLWQLLMDVCEHLHTMSALQFAFYDTWWTVTNTRKVIRK